MSVILSDIQLAYYTLAQYTAWDGILKEGQLSIVSDAIGDAFRTKIGDGVTKWTALPYYNPASSSQDLQQTLGFGNTTGGNNIVMSGTDVISDSTGTNMFVDLNASTIYSTDGLNRMAFTADISGKTSEISVRDYSVISLEKGYVSAGLTDIYSGVISQSTGWYNQIHTNLSHIEVQSNWANFRGIEYLNDWSANYSLRSLVDKGYVINNFVPYTGATSDVDLGAYLLSTKSIRVTGTSGSGDIHLRHQSTDATATGQSTSLFADVNGDLKWKNDGNYYTTLKTSTNTANRIYTYPDADGTIALTSNKLSQFATTTSSELAGVISDETGTGALVFGTSPTFTTDITTPLIIGGSAVGSNITYKSTSGAGTATVAAHTFTGGTNGGTTIATLYNNGNFSIGNYASPNNLRLVTIGQDTAYMSFGSLVGATSYGAIYINQATPSTSNYTITSDGLISALNASTIAYVRVLNNNRITVSNTDQSFTPAAATSGAVTTFTFTKPNNTGQTASTAVNGVLWTLGTRQWASGAITTLQKEFELTSPTYSFVGASTITSAYSFYVNPPVAGTNATISTAYAAGFNGRVRIEGIVNLGDGRIFSDAGMDFNAGSNSIRFFVGGAGVGTYTATTFTATPSASTSGAVSNFTFTSSANTGQTASAEISNFKVNGASKTWAVGAISTQRWNYFTGNTAAFASASTITNSYGLYVEAATAGTNATITNNWAAGFSGNVNIAIGGNTTTTTAKDLTISGIGSGGGILCDTQASNVAAAWRFARAGTEGIYLGYDSGSNNHIALINRLSGDLYFSSNNTKRMVVDANGSIVLGAQSTLSTSATDGFVYIPTSAGAPTGVPTAYTGKVAMQYDTTNNKLYIYNGGWKSVTLA